MALKAQMVSMSEEDADQCASALFLISIFAYEPKILFIAAAVNLARIVLFGFGKKLEPIEFISACALLSSITIFGFLQYVGGLNIYLYYLPIYPLLMHLVLQKVVPNRLVLSFVCISALVYRLPDLAFVLEQIINNPVLARIILNNSQFGVEGVFSLNRLFAGVFLAFIILSYLNAPRLYRIIYGLLGLIFFVFISSRISMIGIILGVVLSISSKRAIILIIVSTIVTMAAYLFSFRIEAISRFDLLIQGNDRRFDLFATAKQCMVGYSEILIGANDCLRFHGVTDLDSLLSDMYFRGGIILLALFLFGVGCMIIRVFQVSGFTTISVAAVAAFAVLVNYDSSLSKPEFWGPIALFTLMSRAGLKDYVEPLGHHSK